MYYNSTDQNVPNYTSRGLNLLPYMVVLGTEPSLGLGDIVFLLLSANSAHHVTSFKLIKLLDTFIPNNENQKYFT